MGCCCGQASACPAALPPCHLLAAAALTPRPLLPRSLPARHRRPLPPNRVQPAGTKEDPEATYCGRGQFIHVLAPSRTVVAYRKVTEAEEREEEKRRAAAPPPAVAAIKAAGEAAARNPAIHDGNSGRASW